jgi:hypothetical protein
MIKTMPPAFLFVPHKAGTQRDDRRFINTHLSHRAAARRKQGKSKTQTAQAAEITPLSRNARLPTRSRSEEDAPEANPSDGDVTPTITTVSLASNPSFEIENPSFSAGASSPGPTSLITNGNYDPFSVALIPMTAPVRTLLHFNDTIFQPWGEGIEKGFHKRAAFSNKFFQTGNQLLQDQTTGYAFLARLASMAATLTSNQSLSIAAAGFKSQAYENLRQHMMAHGMESGTLLYSQMFSLLAMEIAAHNLDAAAIHARTLQQLIQNAPITDCVNVGEDLICSVLWHECLRGGFSLQRPAFEVDQLLDQASMRNTLAAAKKELDARGIMPPQRFNGFKAAGLAHDISGCVGELRFMADLTYAFGHRSPLVSSRLLKLYNNAQDYLADGAYPGYESEFHTAAAACLAARFWYRVATSHESVDVPPTAGFQLYRIYGTHKSILRQLKEAHEAYQEFGEQQRKQNLWLWILYVGTLAERANTSGAPDPEQWKDGYFNVQFVSMARSMGVLCWADMEEIFGTFLYSDAVGVRSRQYFAEGLLMQPNG